jgi:hypothetical protein
VAEKSVSVSNLINGATRLQPVVMQLGQAAGALAALSRIQGKSVKKVAVRDVQIVLLDSGCYLMPFLDLPKDSRHFKALQRIGATGILRGEGRNVGWTNQTWFRAEDPLLAEEIFTEGYYDGILPLAKGPVKVGRFIDALRSLGVPFPASAESWWAAHGLDDFNPDRVLTRLEAAVMIDAAIDPFIKFPVDHLGNLR